MAKINTEKEDIKRYVNEANRRLGTDRSFICEKREKFVKWLRDNASENNKYDKRR